VNRQATKETTMTTTTHTTIAKLSTRAVDWTALAARLAARWRAWLAGRRARVQRDALERLDRYWQSRRNAHERFLSQASDVYELERLERHWERHQDFWRI
jgi:hypothetical protein